MANRPSAEWWLLRNIVLDAVDQKRMPEEAAAVSDHPVVALIEKFIQTGDERFINEAAKIVAMAKPGISPEVASKEAWLVIEKS